MDDSSTRIRPEVSSARRTAATCICPVERTGALPLSYSQRLLWLSAQRSPSSWHHVTARLRLRGKLDRPALRAALDRIVARHDVLRTTFQLIEREPKQFIGPVDTGFPLLEQDVESHEAIEQASRQEALDPFDLSSGPLIRGRLLRVSEDEHVMLLTLHRIVSDSSSMSVVKRELSALYNAFALGRDDPLPPLEFQYADYASWQLQHITIDVLNEELEFWTQSLADVPTLSQLAPDRPRGSLQYGASDRVRLKLSTALTKRLVQLARKQRVSLFVTLLSGWAVLLGRWCGQVEMFIGTRVAKRQPAEASSLIGPFENTLVLRICMQQDPTVEQLLKHVKAVVADAYAHQDVPFEKVVDALDPIPNCNRLAQLQVAMDDAAAMDSVEVQLAGLKVMDVSVGSTNAPFELSLSMSDEKEGLTATLEYVSDLFERKTIERMAACWETLLKGMVKHPRRPISRIAMLPAAERDQVLYQFNRGTVSIPQEKLIHTLFEEQAERTPDSIAVIYEDQSLTYTELNQRANQLARYLRKIGVSTNQLVGICVERSLEMVVGLLGILKTGAAYVPLDPNYPAERLAYMLEDAAPHVVLTQEKLTAALPATASELIALDRKWGEIKEYPNENLSVSELGRPGAPTRVYVIYTSGSTGRPKGTEMAHRSMVNLIEWHRQSFPATKDTRVLQFAALSFDVAFQEIFTTLCTGTTLVMLDEWVRRDVRALMQLLSQQSIQRLFLPPLMLQSLAEISQSAGIVPASLQDVITAGEQLRISAQIRGFFKRLTTCRLHNHYGPTESHVVTALTLTGDPEAWPALPTIGQPIANTQIYVLDGQRQPVPVGVPGEIYIGGANVALGYLNRPELTAQRFIADPFSADPQARVYKTGDLGRWRADGTLEYLGRNDDQVKIRGFRIELGEIEAQLAHHPGVKEAVVIARDDGQAGQRLVAYVTRRADSDPAVEELRSHLQAALPEHMVPSAFVMLAQLPVTPSGKVDRRALPEPPATAHGSRSYEAPQNPLEESLAAIWQELLGIERVGRHDIFLELGGHSLLATRVVARIRSQWSVEMPAGALFEFPTVMQLAAQVAELHDAKPRHGSGEDGRDLEGLLEEVTSMPDDQVQRLLKEFRLGGRT